MAVKHLTINFGKNVGFLSRGKSILKKLPLFSTAPTLRTPHRYINIKQFVIICPVKIYFFTSKPVKIIILVMLHDKEQLSEVNIVFMCNILIKTSAAILRKFF